MDRTHREQAILSVGREGVRRRLVDEKRIPERDAESWCRAWETEAERRATKRDADYWRHGSQWILAPLVDGRRMPERDQRARSD